MPAENQNTADAELDNEATGPEDNFAPEIADSEIEIVDSDLSVDAVGGDNRDTVDQAADDLDGGDDSQPDADNPNDFGEDVSA